MKFTAATLKTSLHESLSPCASIQQLQSSGPHHECFRLVRALRGPINYAHTNAETDKFAGQRHAHRAGADNQDLRVHGFLQEWQA
jgi:hypothetical protein